MLNKIVTLDNEERYLIILEKKVDDKNFLIGIKLQGDKYLNEFKLFLEKKIENVLSFEEIEDEELLKVLVNSYVLNKFF